MTKPLKIIVDKCRGYQFPITKRKYDQNDIILYALSIGVSRNPLDMNDLKYTYENSEDFGPVPSMAVCLPSMAGMFEGLIACPGMPEFNPMMLLHGEHKVKILKPLPTEATVRNEVTIKDVYDKTKAALVVVETKSFDDDKGDLLCVNEAQLFIRGIGNFGGPKGEKGAVHSSNRAPDSKYVFSSREDQALLYRLNGDVNPLHADPNMAAMGGFEKPILHGLCSLGSAVHGIVKNMCNNDPTQVESFECRFMSPVLPGQKVQTEMWNENGRIIFQVRNIDTDKIAIGNGALMLRSRSKL
eukprot:GHVL01013762.1.p1 GENE.GHVL01013762.1~~GHVL01013762.1.p1  ORF type:complete len:299 (-),score=47.59 GHVL01013762.1:176-1072(-)